MTTRTSEDRPIIDLSTPLSMESSFRFPLQSADARREILWGAVLLVLLPGIGWFLNMEHRIVVVHRMQHGQRPWPAWHDYRRLFRHGVITAGGMLYYYAPGFTFVYLAWHFGSALLALVAGALLLAATIAIPGYMSHYCWEFDPSEIYDPLRALRRCTGWRRLLAGLAYNPFGACDIFRRAPRVGGWIFSDQRVVLASGRLFLRQRVHATVWPYGREAG
jgi:hypothetical protein